MLKYFSLPLLCVTLLLVGCRSNSDLVMNPLNTQVQTGGIILALGDSLTAGLGVSPELNYPSQLESELQKLGYHYTVQNAGVSGDTSSQLLARMNWVLDGISPNPPALVILEIGANDAFQ